MVNFSLKSTNNILFSLGVNGIIANPDTIPIPNDINKAFDSDISSKPIPFPPLYMIKNEFNNNVRPTKIGNNTYALSKLFSLLVIRMVLL